jgi:endo-1,4-beta-xylanase
VTRRAVALAVIALGSVATACSDDGGSSGDSARPTVTTSAPDCTRLAACTTRQLADAAGVTFGTAVPARLLDEADYTKTLLATFNSVTPENDLKWSFVHPAPDEWEFGPVDRLMAFANEHGLAVKGHNLVWDQEVVDSTPDWALAIDDPAELRAVVREHFTTLMERYDGEIDRWDVVNEPLQTTGPALYDNHFRRVLGDGYIAELFRLADDIDPDARLFLNEATVEYFPAKAGALVELVRSLVADDVPIDGVGLQGHLVSGSVTSGVLREMIAEFEGLGLEVAITELDVPITDQSEDPLAAQADAYETALAECFAQACREVTLWGFTDRYTWIDDFLGPGRAPLPFDRQYQPKPALAAIREQLGRLVAAP